MNPSYPDDTGSPSPLGTILMVMITLVLAVLVLLVAIPMPYTLSDASVPSIFKILKIRHDDGSGHLNFESYMVLKNTGNTNYDNWNLFVLTYVGGEQIPAEIPTLNANEQAADHVHHLVQTLGGLGASGSRKKGNAIWPPGALLSIDYKDGTFHPGDMVTIEVYNKTTRQIISRDMYKA